MMKDIFDIKEVVNIVRVENEYDLQKASLLERILRLMIDENPYLKPIRKYSLLDYADGLFSGI